jgi:Ca-activated chloride channel homolog
VRFGANRKSLMRTNYSLIVAGFVLAFLSATPCRPQERQDDTVVLRVAVGTTTGERIMGLTPENFQVYADDQLQPVTSFKTGHEMPMTMGVLVDRSGSLEKFDLNIVLDALKDLVHSSPTKNEYFLATFSDDTPAFIVDCTQDTEAFLTGTKSLAVVPAKGSTRLYDSLIYCLDKLRKGKFEKKILILVTDRLDNGSLHSSADLVRAARESDVTVYQVNVPVLNSASKGVFMETPAGDRWLNEVFRITGGGQLEPKSSSYLFEALRWALQDQYVIGFKRPAAGKSGKARWMQLKIKVDLPVGLTVAGKPLVFTREGIYSRGG